MAVLDEKKFERVKKNLMGLIIASFIFAGLQMAVDSLSSEQRCLSEAGVQQVGEWVGIQHHPPSRNVWGVMKQH